MTEEISSLKRNGLLKEELGEATYLSAITHLIKTESYREILPLGTAARFDSLLPIKEILPKATERDHFFQEYLSKYSFPPGDLELRGWIAQWQEPREMRTIPDDLVLTSGALEAIYLP